MGDTRDFFEAMHNYIEEITKPIIEQLDDFEDDNELDKNRFNSIREELQRIGQEVYDHQSYEQDEADHAEEGYLAELEKLEEAKSSVSDISEELERLILEYDIQDEEVREIKARVLDVGKELVRNENVILTTKEELRKLEEE
jgi:hypothetical protein